MKISSVLRMLIGSWLVKAETSFRANAASHNIDPITNTLLPASLVKS